MRPLPIVATASAAWSIPGRTLSAPNRWLRRGPCRGRRRVAYRERHIAHGVKALCLAIIRASATVRAPSSILKRLSSLALAPCSAASPAARAVCAVSGLTNQCLLGRAGAPGTRGNPADGDAQRRAPCRRPSARPPPPRRGRKHRTPGPGSCDRSMRGLAASLAHGCAGSIRRTPAWSRCWRGARLAMQIFNARWSSHPWARACPPWHRRRTGRPPSRRDRRRCRPRCRRAARGRG